MFKQSYNRILVSYLVILGVPMIALTSIGYSMVTTAAYRETAGHKAELVERVRTAVDREIAHITAIAHAIDRDFEIRHPRAFGDPPDVMTIQRRFHALVSTNRFVQEIIYAARGVQPYIGSTGVFSPTAVLYAYARRDILDGYRFNQVLESVRRPGFILLRETIEADGPFLFYAHPLGLRTDRPAVVVFVVPTANLLGVVSGAAVSVANPPAMQTAAAERGSGSFILVDPYGSVVLAHPPLDRPVLATAVRYAQHPEPVAAATQVDRHIIARATSAESGWTAMLVTPIDATTAVVRAELRGLLIVVLLLIAIEIALLELFLRWNYRPVSVLLHDVEHPDHPNAIAAGALPAELSAVHTALLDAHRSQEVGRATRELCAAIASSQPDALTVSALMRRIGIDATAPGFRVLSARVRRASAPMADCSGDVRSALEPLGMTVHPIEASAREIAWLIAGPSESIAEPIERTHPSLERAAGATVYVGLGRLVNRVDEIGLSLRDARDASLGALLTGRPSIVGRESGATTPARTGAQPRDSDRQSIELLIESGGTDDATAALTRLVEALRDDNGPASDLLQRALVLSVVVLNRVGSGSGDRPSDARDAFAERVRAANASLLDGAMPIDAWGDALKVIIVDADRSQRERTAESNAATTRASAVLSYVEEHLFDANLSLAAVAGSVGVSLSTAAALFKRRTGTTLTGYVGDRRVAEAKRLLREGIPVNDVVDRIGYRDSTSFIRKFKRMTGTTPGEWLSDRIASASVPAGSR